MYFIALDGYTTPALTSAESLIPYLTDLRSFSWFTLVFCVNRYLLYSVEESDVDTVHVFTISVVQG